MLIEWNTAWLLQYSALGSSIELWDTISLITIALPHWIPTWSHYLLKINLSGTYYDTFWLQQPWLGGVLVLFSEWRKKAKNTK